MLRGSTRPYRPGHRITRWCDLLARWSGALEDQRSGTSAVCRLKPIDLNALQLFGLWLTAVNRAGLATAFGVSGEHISAVTHRPDAGEHGCAAPRDGECDRGDDQSTPALVSGVSSEPHLHPAALSVTGRLRTDPDRRGILPTAHNIHRLPVRSRRRVHRPGCATSKDSAQKHCLDDRRRCI